MSMRPWSRRLATLRILIVAVGILFAAAMTAQAAEPYRLGLSDRLTVRVVEWQDADGTFTAWSALAGDYTVGADGTIAFPYVGAVLASGATTTELAAALQSGLGEALGLTDPPDITIEVAAFGPVYVAGAVKTPGAYPFAPGLNVIKLVSLAGGTRLAEAADGRDLITMQGTLDVLRAQRVRLLVHLARLDAVLAGKTEIDVPAELVKAAAVAPLVAAETAEMSTLARQLADRVESLASQEGMVAKTLESLKQKQALTEAQLVSARQQLEKAQSLVDNGLAVATRVSALQTGVADLETRQLDIQTAQLRAEQDLNNMAVQRSKATSDKFLQTSQERQQAAAQLDELELKIATQERLIVEVSGLSALASDDRVPAYDYVILRGGSQIAASEVEAVLPGDVVSVSIRSTQ